METHRCGDRCRVTHAATPPAVVSRPPNSSVHPLHFIHSNTAVFYPTKIRSPLSRLITSAPFLHPYSTTAGLPHSQPAHHSSPDDESSPLPPSLSFPFHTTQAISINIGVLVLSSPAACASSAVILSVLLCCLRSLPACIVPDSFSSRLALRWQLGVHLFQAKHHLSCVGPLLGVSFPHVSEKLRQTKCDVKPKDGRHDGAGERGQKPWGSPVSKQTKSHPASDQDYCTKAPVRPVR